LASNNVWKLTNRLEEEFGIITDVETFHRTRAGRHLLSGGAFTWIIIVKEFEGRKVDRFLGGFEPLSKHIILKNRLQIRQNRFGDIELYVYSPDDIGYNDIESI